MAWMDEINIFEQGIQLPTHGQWINVPSSPFQVMTHDSDNVGAVHIRVTPAYAHHWNEFLAMMESGN